MAQFLSVPGFIAWGLGASTSTVQAVSSADWAFWVAGGAAAGGAYLKKNLSKKPESNYHKMTAKTKRTTKRKATKKAQKPRMVMTQAVRYAPEIKHYDKELDPFYPCTNGSWHSLGTHSAWIGCNPPLGTDWNARVGRRIRIVGMEYTMTWGTNGSGIQNISMAQTGGVLICQIWQDRKCNGVLATPLNVYDGAVINDSGPTQVNIRSPRLTNNANRFKLVHEARHLLEIQGTSGTAYPHTVNGVNLVKIKKRLNVPVNFGDGAPEAIGEIKDNSFFMMMSTTLAVLATGAPPLICYGAVRFSYVDV